MVPALILTLVAVVGYRVRQLTRRTTPNLTVHPPEGYFFGDPASPTREERQRMLLGWSAPHSRELADRRVDASASA